MQNLLKVSIFPIVFLTFLNVDTHRSSTVEKEQAANYRKKDALNPESLSAIKDLIQWHFEIESVVLSPTTILSFDARLTYQGKNPIRTDLNQTREYVFSDVRIWDKEFNKSIMLKPVGTGERGSSSTDSFFRTVSPGETVHIHWEPLNGAEYEFVQIENVQSSYISDCTPIRLQPGKQYLVDGFINISDTRYLTPLSIVGVTIISSNKIPVTVQNHENGK